MPFVRIILLLALVVWLPMASAATDGLLGRESEATTLVTFVKQNSVRLSGINDIHLGSRASLTSSEQHTDDVCVYTSTGAYAVTATSLNGAFELRSEDGTDAILYRLQWISGGTQDLLPSVTIRGLPGHVSDIDCNGELNASIRIIVSASSFNDADPGVYTDTLMLLVRAE